MTTTTTSERKRQAGASHLSDDDHALLTAAKRALGAGIELRRWWQNTDAAGGYAETYPESFVFRRAEDTSFGFFDEVELSSSVIPVIGSVTDMLYDRPKGSTPEMMRDQVREFVLRYFMRVSDFRAPQKVPDTDRGERGEDYVARGFGYSQRYYKARETGEEAAFPEAERDAIIDLRELADNYEWIVVRNPILGFGFEMKPFGPSSPELIIPIPAANDLILSRDTITHEEEPEEGVLGRYGIGYAFIRDPGEPGMFAYGPGQLEPALQLINWEVRDTGEVRARMVFVSRAPEGLFNIPLNPVGWGLSMADKMSAGVFSEVLGPLRSAAEQMPLADTRIDPVLPTVRWLNRLTGDSADKYLGISEREIDKGLLYTHFIKHYDALRGSTQVWRRFADWTDESSLPEWVKTGRSIRDGDGAAG